MKNETTRTKTLSGFSSRAIALVLCFVMLLTAIGSGSVLSAIAADFEGNGAAVLVDAAKAGASVDVAADVAAADDKAAADEDEAPLTKKADSDLADTGRDADLAETGFSTTSWIKLKGDWDSWTDHWIEPGTSAHFDFTSLSANTDRQFSLNVNESGNDYYFNSGATLNLSNSSNYTWNTSSSGNNKFHIVDPCSFDVTFTWEGNGSSVKLTISNVSTGSSAKDIYVMGPQFGGWDYANVTDKNKKLTMYSSGLYKIEHTVDSTPNDDNFRFYNKKDDTHYSPTVEAQVDLSTSGASSKTSVEASWRNQVFSFKNFTAGDKVTLWLDITNNTTWATYTVPDYYLTGYVNGTDYSGKSYKFGGSGDNYTYVLNSTSASQYLTITDSFGYTYHPGTHPAANGAAYTYTDNKPAGDNKWGITSGASGKNITFTWKPNSKTLSWTISSGGNIDVFAKDGAAPINWKDKNNPGATDLTGTTVDGKQEYYYNYGIIGRTTISQIAGSTASGVSTVDCGIAGGTSGSKYDFKNIEVGKTITIRTTIEPDYRNKYYVAGWCVNGITYKNGEDTVGVNAAEDTPISTGVCEFTYTLPSDTEGMLKDKAGNPVVEITPIYYLREKSNTVTFYLEGYSDVQKKWGNTPYCYPFYGNLNGYQSTFGVYPGQPMVNVGGQISIEIPIYTKPISGSVATTVIKGVTVSNGYADHVHRNLVYGWKTAAGDVNNDVDHMQTYDYDDFHKIWAERIVSGQHPNAIFFRIKEETNKYNRSTYGGGSTSGQFATGTSNIDIAAIASSGNGWELMKDRHDRPVNIFGDYNAVKSVIPGASAEADTSNAIYVVSTGYNANIAGDYGTMWKIYNGSGQLISNAGGRVGIPPSLLNLAGNASSGMTSTVSYPSANHSVSGVGSYTDANSNYNAIYKALKASTYTGKLVYITYEKDTQDTRNTATGEGAYRVDGKWFYTHASDDVTSTIGIEYYDRATGTWKTDTISNDGLGTTTKATAAFNSGSYTGTNKITSKKCLISDDITLYFTATESGTDNKYAFSGWYLKYDDTYEHVTGSTTTGSIKATANYSLIARYVPVVTNSLVITHKLDPESTGTGEAKMTVTYGGTTQEVHYINGVANAEINVSWATAPKNIDVTLTATPQNDGRVDSISVDNQISHYNTNTSVPSDFPSTTDGQVATRTLSFTDHDVYNSAGTSIVISQLDYVSKINATPHYYDFTYTFKDRGGATKNYTARGVISEDHYAEYVNSDHQVSDAFVKSRAPFESNFLQTLKLDTISGKDYDTSTHTLSATATYNATPYTPVYDVKIKLPYVYHDAAGGSGASAYKKYTAANDIYVTNPNTFTLKANYDEFVTIGATETTAGPQTKVSKVVDVADDPNHTGNDFITAPNTLSGGRYFRYWEIKRLADNDADQAEAPLISRIYYPDLNYRFYADSYVEAVYTTNKAEYWSNVNKNHANLELSCSVLYLESSRNQWNMNGSNTTNTSSTVAADKIYNDFIFSYRLGDEEYIPDSKAEIGMILERVYTNKSGTKAWVEGDSSITDMDSYKADNSGTENKNAIIAGLTSGTLPKNCFKQVWDNSELNNKNYTEQNTAVYSQFGQKVDTHSITFNSDSANDNYVYRAWAYIKDKSTDNVAVSDPAYFSMNFVASQNYSE